MSGRAATIPAQRGAPSLERGGAAGRAYARRDDRLRRLVGGARSPRGAAPAGRAKFVLLVMSLLAVGLVLTLWLSTAAAADSYRLQDARAAARTLSEQSEQLRREVTAMDAAPALAQRAAQLGMVPVQDSARLVVAPDGAVTVSGTPKAAVATAPPPPPVSNGATPSGSPSTAGPTATPSATPEGTDPTGLTADAAAAAGVAPDAASAAATTATPQASATATATATAAPTSTQPSSRTMAASATKTAAATATTTPAASAAGATTTGPTRTSAAHASGAAVGAGR